MYAFARRKLKIDAYNPTGVMRPAPIDRLKPQTDHRRLVLEACLHVHFAPVPAPSISNSRCGQNLVQSVAVADILPCVYRQTFLFEQA